MSSIYTSFPNFMREAVNKAKQIDDFGKDEAFYLTATIMPAVGWTGFLLLASLLYLGPIAFAVTLVTFLTTPVGLAIAVAVGTSSAVAIRKLYKDRAIPLRAIASNLRLP